MSVLNTTCPICTEIFDNAGDVYSTSCGHLYHHMCMSQWQSRSTSCPQCRHYNPTTHKIYLSFGESVDTLVNKEEMEQQLKSSNEKIEELQMQNSEMEINFMQLQEQYTDSSRLIKGLEDRIKQLSIANECKTFQLQLAIAERESLKTSHLANQTGMSADNRLLNQEITTLVQQFESISLELEKEINANTQLSIENTKLKSLMKNSNAMEENGQTTNEHNSIKLPKRIPLNRKYQNENRNPRKSHNKCIIIKNLPHCLIVVPYKKIVINLAAELGMTMSYDDLHIVKIVDGDRSKWFAKFKSQDLKETFLARKISLKKNPLTEPLRIREFMSENAYELFQYAKEKLKGNGFNCIFSANNKIYAKEHRQKRNVVQIESKQQVDKLQQENVHNETNCSTGLSKDDSTKVSDDGCLIM